MGMVERVWKIRGVYSSDVLIDRGKIVGGGVGNCEGKISGKFKVFDGTVKTIVRNDLRKFGVDADVGEFCNDISFDFSGIFSAVKDD